MIDSLCRKNRPQRRCEARERRGRFVSAPNLRRSKGPERMQPLRMLQLARSFRVVTLALPLLAGAGCGGGGNDKPAKTPATTDERLVPASSESRCAIRISPDKKLTEITSQQDGYGLLLPGSTWDVQCN